MIYALSIAEIFDLFKIKVCFDFSNSDSFFTPRSAKEFKTIDKLWIGNLSVFSIDFVISKVKAAISRCSKWARL